MYRDSYRSIKSKGISLIETLAAVTILSIGIVSVMAGMGAMARAEARVKTVETMTTLAEHKYDELIAITPTLDSSLSGDFQDQNISNYTWSADVEQTGVTNLIAMTVTVSSTTDTTPSAPIGKVSGLIYVPPATTTTTTTTTTNGGGAAGGRG